nr:cytochrome c oxidase subunit 3 [Kofleriaceae bacterium]
MSDAHDAHDDHHGADHHGSPFVQHHYDDAQHQFDAGKLGIWIFLGQEVLFFSALFVAYVLYRVHHPEIFSYAHKYLQVKFGAINTAVLIFSSLTAAWAVRCAQRNERKGLILCIVVTILCACGFLTIKYMEYSHKIHEHILFGRYFDPCVTSGGDELLTKRNECAGSKGNVVFDLSADKAS